MKNYTAVFNEFYDERKPKKLKINFSEWAEIYLLDYSRLNKSYKDDRSRMRSLKEFFRDKELREITAGDVQRFRKLRLDQGNSKSTCNRYIALLKRVLNVAAQQNYLESNPASKVKQFPEEGKGRIITEEEEQRLLAVCSETLRSVLIIGVNTGLRTGKIYALKWSQIDFENRILTVEETKNSKSRKVPLNQKVIDELQCLKMNNGSPYVLFNQKTGKPITTVRNSWARACKKAGIEGRRLYDATRHTFGSRLVQRGADIETVRELMGHADISTTQRYVHSHAEAKRKAVNLLNKESRMGPIYYTTGTWGKGERSKQLPNQLFSVN